MERNIDLSNVILYTPRLVIRPHTISDLYDFYEYAKEPGVGELAGWSHHKDVLETKRILDMFSVSKRVLAVALRDTNKVIGSVSLDFDRYHLEGCEAEVGASLGFILGKKYWHQGYMNEAVREMMRFAFLDLQLDYLLTSCYKDNKASIKLIDKRGFRFVKEVIFETRFKTKVLSNLYIARRSEFVSHSERIKLYDESLNDTPIWIYRGAPIPEGYHVGVVDIIIKNTKYNKYLLTKRSTKKDKHPGKLETTGGLISYGESEEEAARRELKEETGIEDVDLKLLYRTTLDSFLYYEYYAETRCMLDSIRLQDGETEGYCWCDLEDYLKVWKSNLTADRAKIRLAKALEGLK